MDFTLSEQFLSRDASLLITAHDLQFVGSTRIFRSLEVFLLISFKVSRLQWSGGNCLRRLMINKSTRHRSTDVSDYKTRRGKESRVKTSNVEKNMW